MYMFLTPGFLLVFLFYLLAEFSNPRGIQRVNSRKHHPHPSNIEYSKILFFFMFLKRQTLDFQCLNHVSYPRMPLAMISLGLPGLIQPSALLSLFIYPHATGQAVIIVWITKTILGSSARGMIFL